MNTDWIKNGKFVELPEDQIKKLSTEELAAYTNDKFSYNTDININSVKNEINELKNNLNSYATTSDIENKIKLIERKFSEIKIDDEIKNEISELKIMIDKNGTEINKLKDVGSVSNTNITNQVYNILKNKADALKEFKASDKTDHKLIFTIKAAGNILRSNITDDTMAQRVIGIGQIERRIPFISELFTQGRISPNNHGVIKYVDQDAITNSAAQIAEGNAFTLSDVKWKEYSINIEKTGDYMKLSREMMDDVDYVEGEINNVLLRNVELKVDSQLLTGNGTSPNLIGIATSATEFTAGSFASKISDASYYDLISVASSQIMNGTSFLPNAVLMNPVDYTRMKLKKDAEYNYVIPPFVAATLNGGTLIENMIIKSNSGVAENTMYIGDFTRGTYYSGDLIQIEFGYINDDFGKDLVSVLARKRNCLLIRNVSKGGFIKITNINDALAAIDSTP